MPTLKITIKMDNAAFDPEGPEVARILRKLANLLAREWDGRHIGDGEQELLRDLNGNTVGEAKVTR